LIRRTLVIGGCISCPLELPSRRPGNALALYPIARKIADRRSAHPGIPFAEAAPDTYLSPCNVRPPKHETRAARTFLSPDHPPAMPGRLSLCAGRDRLRRRKRVWSAPLPILPFKEFEFHGFLGKRRVRLLRLSPTTTTAAACRRPRRYRVSAAAARARAAASPALRPIACSNALITDTGRAQRSAGIRDRPQYGDVIGISLVSPCTFRLRRKRSAAWSAPACASTPLGLSDARLIARRMGATVSGGGGASLLGHLPRAARCCTCDRTEQAEIVGPG